MKKTFSVFGTTGNERRKFALLAFTVLFLLTLLTLTTPAAYADSYNSYEYYIKDFLVDVVVGNDRSYEVTETITVYFNIESRGIFRDIQTVSSVERYRVENINVAGDPFVVTEHSDYINVRIGDPDVWLTGEKTYVITYTRLQFDDNEPDYDYFYMDLIGDGWDVPVADFEATVRLPEDAEINRYTLTSGPTGSTGNDYAAAAVSGGVITVGMNRPLGPHMAVTLNVEMPQGTFPEVPVYAKPLVVHCIDISAVLDMYGAMTVTEVYDATVNDRVPYFIHPVFVRSGASAAVWFDPDGNERGYGSYSADFLNDYIGKRVQFTFIYKRTFPISGFDRNPSFEVELFDNESSITVENYKVSVVSPFEISYASFRERFGERDPGAYFMSLSDNGRRLYFEAEADPSAYYPSVEFYSYGFRRTVSPADFIIPLLAVAAAVLLCYFAFVRDPEKKIVAPIEFYPPENLNPAEAGYIIDGNVSGRDVTSLIYYWASHGHLSIEVAGKAKNFTLHKLGDLDDAHLPYENVMFRGLWLCGDNDTVTSKDLKNKFYSTVSKTASAVKSSYTGDRSLNRLGRVAGLIVFAMMVFCAVLFYAFSQLWVYTGDETATAGFFAVLLYLVLSVVIFKHHQYRYKDPITCKLLLIAFLVLDAVFAVLVFTTTAGKSLTIAGAVVTAASLAVTAFTTTFLRRKTDFGIYLLERVIGFQLFLTTAERARLQMLLEQNPDYYYNILPYAQCLGVSRIWEKKFDGLLRQPPTWCYGDGADTVIGSAGLAGITRSLSNSMTSRPVSIDSGSSGGGGGFSGGGSSGGGGGGGGGRW